MSDTTLNRFLARGTTAARLAFTPSAPTPASGPDPGYLWWDTDLQAEYAYDFGLAAWVATSASAGSTVPAPTANSFVVSGGQIVWQSALTFLVSAATYYINGVLFSSAQTSVTLGAADPSNPRIDVIAVNDASGVVVVAGTAAAQPSEPTIDPGTQLALGFIEVPAGATAPPSVTNTILYADDAGSPTEWNWTTSGSGWNLASTNNPRSGTKDIETTSAAAGSYAQGQIGSGTFDPSAATIFVCYLRNKSAWANKHTLQVQCLRSGVIEGSPVTIKGGAFGFDATQTASYQQVAIPLTQFAIPAGTLIDQVRVVDQGGALSFYLDDIAFQGGAVTQTVVGITQAQADARYAPLDPSFVTLATDATLPNERVLTAGAGVSLTDGGAGGTLTIAATGGSGTVTHTAGALAANALAVGNGAADLKTVAATDGQIPIGKSADGSVTLATLTGTANEVIVTNGAASVTLSTPQAIGTSSTPQFARIGAGAAADAAAVAKFAGQYFSPLVNDGNSGTALTLDWNAGNEHLVTLTGNVTFTLSNPVDGGRYVVLLDAGAGGFTVTWPASVAWPGGTAPVITVTAGKVDLVTLIYRAGASKYYGSFNQNY